MESNNIYTTPTVKKRKRDPLAPNWSDQKYAAVTMPGGHSFLAGAKAHEDSKELYRKYHSRIGRKNACILGSIRRDG